MGVMLTVVVGDNWTVDSGGTAASSGGETYDDGGEYNTDSECRCRTCEI